MKNAWDVKPENLSGLWAFKEDYPEAKSLLVYRGREKIMSHGVLLVPAEEFLKYMAPSEFLVN